ncbi:helix-turn-helix domain-containing protein [Actinosynnema sp. NPDC059797]
MRNQPSPQQDDLRLQQKVEAVDRIDDSTAVSPDGVRSTGQPQGDDDRLLHTPAQAARILTIRESWLRRMAGQRKIPCTFVGKHLRFSSADLGVIVQRGARPVRRSMPSSRNSSVRSFDRRCD